MRSVSSLIWVGLLQEMIVVLGLPVNVATIILSYIFSMIFSDFRSRSPISIPTPPIVALIEFFHADAGTKRGASCWGWSPGSSVKKSAIELKLKQKLLKCKSTL